MKILVTVKQVIDPYVAVRVKPDETGVITDNTKMAMNPFDEIALEEAIRLKEKNFATEVIVVSIGPRSAQEALYHGLALGADRALLIETTEDHCPLHVATILHKITLEMSPQVILMGKQSIDGDNTQTPQLLAGLLDWPQATFVSRIDPSSQSLTVSREVDQGLETWSIELPAVISVDLRLNTPRYASLPNIMQAKRKPFEIRPLAKLALTLTPHLKTLKVTSPPTRSKGILVNSVTELVDKLTLEAKVLEH